MGLISEKQLFRVALGALLVAAAIGIALLFLSGPALILFGIVGAFSAYFYTAPPLRFAARKGIGELLVGLNFGPLMVAGTVYALTGSASPVDFLIGLPAGLLITAILWINQFPDMETDRAAGKHNLVVVLGKERARWGYAALVLGAFALVVAGVAANILPFSALLTLLALPIALWTTVHLFRYYQDRELIKANSGTIVLHVLAGTLMALSLVFAGPISSLL